MSFLEKWGEAAYTSIGFFWMALWAFALGYILSSLIQVFVTRDRMQKAMGKSGAKSVGLGAFFGFISSSCSFAALSTTRALFKKGAGFVPSMAFLLASTNLVIELGLVIAVFMSWHFVVGEYVGGIILILVMWLVVRLTYPGKLIKKVRKKLENEDDGHHSEDKTGWKKKIKTREGWSKVGKKYIGEWNMVWKDVTLGFTIAGVIAAFVPPQAYEWLFVGTSATSDGGDLSFLEVLEHTLVGPVAAFMTFIGSMGNIPLASLLFENGVSVAGVMAFIFSDLVVFPVLRINAKYYNWRMSFYILFTLLLALVATSLILHYGFHFFDMVPQGGSQGAEGQNRTFFKIDYSLYLNIAFLFITGVMIWLSRLRKSGMDHQMADKGWVESLLFYLSLISYGWLAGGLTMKYFIL